MAGLYAIGEIIVGCMHICWVIDRVCEVYTHTCMYICIIYIYYTHSVNGPTYIHTTNNNIPMIYDQNNYSYTHIHCIYVYAHYIYICMSLYIYIYSLTSYIYIYACVHGCGYLDYRSFCMCICCAIDGMCVEYIHTHTHTHTHVCIYIYVFVGCVVLVMNNSTTKQNNMSHST